MISPDNLTAGLDYIFFVYGLAFVILAIISRTLAEGPRRPPWPWLTAFAAVHAANEWADMLAMSLGGELEWLRLSLAALSFVLLLEFGRACCISTQGRGPQRWLHGMLAAAALSGALYGLPGLAVTVRYALGLPGAALAALALLGAARGMELCRARALRSTAAAMALYALATGIVVPKAAFFPASVLNYESFLAVAGFPVQMLRCALAVWMSTSLWLYARTASAGLDQRADELKRRLTIGAMAGLAGLLVIGWGATRFFGDYAATQLKSEHGLDMRSMRSTLDHRLEEVNRLVRLLAGSPSAVAALVRYDADTLAQANAVVDRYCAVAEPSVCYIMRADGLVVASSDRGASDSLIGHNNAFRPYFQEAMAGRLGRYFAEGVTTGKQGYYSSAPVRDSSGTLKGVAVIKRSVRDIEAQLPRGPIALLIDPHGIAFMASRPELRLHSLWPLLDAERNRLIEARQFGNRVFEPILAARPEHAALISLDGQSALALYEPIALDGWSLAWLVPARAVSLYRLGAIAATLLACIAGIIGFRLWDQMIQASLRVAASERRYRSLLQGVPGSVSLLDGEGRLLAVNRYGLAAMGWTEADVLDRCFTDIWPPETQDMARQAVQTALGGGRAELEADLTRPDGTAVSWQVVLSPIYGAEQVGHRFVAFATDITERKRAEAALRDSEERYSLAARAANDGLWDWDLESNKIYFSPRWKAMLGYGEREIEDSTAAWLDRVHPEDIAELRSSIAAHIDGQTPHLECEHRMRHRNGGYRWMLCRGLAARHLDGRAYRVAGSLADITDRRTAQERLLHDALHDTLTGLPNRALLMDRLARAVIRAKRGDDYVFAVMFLDMDDFKFINDSLGHQIGDQLLIEVSQRLQSCLREGDTAARLGGDEFVVLIDDIKGTTYIGTVAERIRTELSRRFSVNGHDVYTTVSIGIAMSESGYQGPDEILRDADTAMYRAKAAGKARYEMFDADMHAQAVQRFQLEAELRGAIERGELVVHYQPVITLSTGRICGLEALVRWQHPKRGLLCPYDFIPLAEQTGIIVSIDHWVLQEVCRQITLWKSITAHKEALRICVNISGRHFTQADLVTDVRRILDESHVEGSYLTLEVTESALMENAELAAQILAELQKLNVQLSIADFGTGYSSLAYLLRFPFQMLKVDRSFVSAMMQHTPHCEILAMIVNLAHTLNMTVVAEGIETHDQIVCLKAMGCECGQGFLLSRPLPPAEAGALLERQTPLLTAFA